MIDRRRWMGGAAVALGGFAGLMRAQAADGLTGLSTGLFNAAAWAALRPPCYIQGAK